MKLTNQHIFMGSSFFPLRYFTLVLLMNAACFFSFAQTTQTLCHKDERSALLQFKASFTIDKSASQNPSAYPKVASWDQLADDPQTSDCCSWDGVECDESSGHVTGIDLASSCLHGSMNPNSSLFQLLDLQRLDLSDNNFSFSQIPSRLGHSFSSLTYLNLSMSSFSGQIPSEFSFLSNLSTLDLSTSSWPPLKLSNFGSLIQNLTRIKQLHLNSVEIDSDVPNTLVNLSSLSSLQLRACKLKSQFPAGIFSLPNLQVLDLADNFDLAGYFRDEINKSSPLKILNLQATDFSGHLPASLGDLRSLNLLNIRSCNFYPYIPSSLSNLTELYFLDLSSFYDYTYLTDLQKTQTFSYHVSDSLSSFQKLAKLNHLALDNIHVRGDLPCSFGNLTQLLVLDLNQNGITGEMPCCLANLEKLSNLSLGYNHMTGQIPSCLARLSQLSVLDLRFNSLQGEIPRSLFELRNLEHVYLHSNDLGGTILLDEFSKLDKLSRLGLSHNKFYVQIKTGFNAIAPKLEVLGLASCNLKEFPEFLKHPNVLEDLDLSNNSLDGQIPKWMWDSTSETLRYLNLSHNHLTGFEGNPVMIPWHGLYSLQLDSNMLQGSLPIPSHLISYYSVSNNQYTGEIPDAFCDTWPLGILDLSDNNLTGKIPRCFEDLRLLQLLKLQNNSFSGEIPQIGLEKCLWLRGIDMSYNQLQGKLPRSIGNCSKLMTINLGNNQISDTFPSWLGKLRNLKLLMLRSNGFYGMIGQPTGSNEFPMMSIIDLSKNDFSGVLPSNYIENWNAMKSDDANEDMYVQSMFFFGTELQTFYYDYPITVFNKGVELKYIKTPYLMRLIDLSSNRFVGEIPGIIGDLRGLKLLDLSNNTLSGLIPTSFGNLIALESLDVSQNQLSGKIPSVLAKLTFLSYFNVSDNHLSGSIPQGPQFDTFQEDMYQGNSGLCGKPLLKKCEDADIPTIYQDEDSRFQIELDWFVVLPGAVAGLVVGVVGGHFLTAKNHDWFVEAFNKRKKPRNTKSRGRFSA